MVREQDALRVVEPHNKAEAGFSTMQPLRQAAMSMAAAGRGRLKTRDLVGILLAHGARSWRSSSPRVHLRLRVEAPGGSNAVKIRL